MMKVVRPGDYDDDENDNGVEDDTQDHSWTPLGTWVQYCTKP